MSESTLTLSDPHLALQLFGPQDTNLRLVRNQLGVAITHRSGQIRISGPADSVRLATEILERLKDKVTRIGTLGPDEVADALTLATGKGNTPAFERQELPRRRWPVHQSVV